MGWRDECGGGERGARTSRCCEHIPASIRAGPAAYLSRRLPELCKNKQSTPRSTHTHVVEDAPGRNEVLRVREHATLLGATPIAIACDAQVEESSSSNFKTRFRAPAASCQ